MKTGEEEKVDFKENKKGLKNSPFYLYNKVILFPSFL